MKCECERRSRASKEDPDIVGCATREERFDPIETARTEIPVDRKSVVGTRVFRRVSRENERLSELRLGRPDRLSPYFVKGNRASK